MTEIAGYSLFKDIEDRNARIFNQARVLKNMMQDFSNTKKDVSGKGVGFITAYMGAIDTEDRADVYVQLEQLIKTKDVE